MTRLVDQPSDLPDLPAGIYRHYKGPLYQTLGYGHDANYEPRNTVVYIGLYLDDARPGPRLSTRTAISSDPAVDAWWDFVHVDRTKCSHGTPTKGRCPADIAVKPRFEYIGPTYQP